MPEITTDYPFKSSPYKHQLDCWNSSKDKEYFALFLEMGCGKSKIVIDTAGYLYRQEKINALVIVAPKGMYSTWPETEIPTHMSDSVPYRIATWSSYARKKERDELEQLMVPGDFLKILVMNVEALNSAKAVGFLAQFLKKYVCLMAIDESTTIKNPSAKRTKTAVTLGRFARYRRICTGNPIPNGPLDLYSQSEFLDRNLLGFSNFFSFRNRFAIMEGKRFGSKSFSKVVGYRDKGLLQQLMQEFSFIIRKDDCLDLPPKIFQIVDVTMGPKQAEAYAKMAQDAVIELAESKLVTAQMVMVQLLRLHQIACGFLKPDTFEEIPFGEPNDRLETLMDLLAQAPGKVIIWAVYRYNIRQIVAAISEKFGRRSVAEYYGDTSKDDRTLARIEFQDPNSSVRFIVSNPATGKFGNTWTQGTTVIYYSNDYNLESREQSESRAHRIGQLGAVHKEGQDPSVLYIDLRVRGTVDDKIILVLKNKKKLTDEIITSNWQWLLGKLEAA